MSELRRISPLRGADPQFSVMELHVSEGRGGGGGLSREGEKLLGRFFLFCPFFFLLLFPFLFLLLSLLYSPVIHHTGFGRS